MTVTIDKLLGVLEVSPLGDSKNTFIGDVLKKDWQRIFGGQVIAQAMAAAQQTLEREMFAHSTYCYFLHPGNPREPIVYEVQAMRDSRSFATRRVLAKQSDKTILSLDVSYHVSEKGLDHQLPMPETPAPENFPSEYDGFPELLAGTYGESVQSWIAERPVEMRFADPDIYFKPENRDTANRVWFRFTDPVEDNIHLRRILLAYVSDYTLLGSALFPHGKRFFDEDMMAASLSHAVWFHRPYDANDWLLYYTDTPSASEALGFCRGSIYGRDGKLIASVAQEGLIRVIDPERRKGR